MTVKPFRDLIHDLLVPDVLIPLVIVCGLGLLLWVFVFDIAPQMEAADKARQEEGIALCMRAYEFSHDRCEFIISNGGRDLVEGGKK